MTLVIYEPDTPAMEFIGHAGAGLYGQDPVCAALSILMYTLIDCAPGAKITSGDGYCRIDSGVGKNQIKAQRSGFDLERKTEGADMELSSLRGSEMQRASFDDGDGYCRVEGKGKENAAYAFAKRGAALLAGSYPRHVHLEVKR